MAFPRRVLFFLLIFLVLFPAKSWSWSLFPGFMPWFQSSNHQGRHSISGNSQGSKDEAWNGVGAEFSIEAFNNPKGVELVEAAKDKLVGPDTCWKNAYRNLFANCAEILSSKEKQSRLAWHLSNCFQKDSGKPPFPSCDGNSLMSECRKKLNDLEHDVFLHFYLDTNTICHQLQSHAFKQEMERLVNELKRSSELADNKIDIITEKSDAISQQSNEIHDSLLSVDLRTQHLAQASKDVEKHIGAILNHSQAIHEQSRDISASQSELQEGQSRLKEQLVEGMAKVHDSHNKLGHEIGKLTNEAIEIEKAIANFRLGMSTKMEKLQDKADDIGNMTGISLEKQRQLLDGQSTALEGLKSLTRSQSKAFEASRIFMQQLAEYGKKQQQEFLHRQERIQRAHDRLMKNSESMLAAQEAFESKQATMFAALDKLFVLHSAMLLESRLIKAFCIYALLIVILYIFTSTKQTYRVRPWLYMGLCATFIIEVLIIRVTSFDIEQQTWIISFLRLTFTLLAAAQLLYSIFTYRDYDMLNHQILLTLIEKVNVIEKENKLLLTDDSDIDWSSWIDTEVVEEADGFDDPDYILPEEVGDSSITTTSGGRRYNLRQRHRI